MAPTTTTKTPTAPDPELIVGGGLRKTPKNDFRDYLGNDAFFPKNIKGHKIYVTSLQKNTFEIRDLIELQSLSQHRKLVFLTARM